MFKSLKEKTLCNLRLLGALKDKEWLQTDNEGNILSYIEYGLVNSMVSVMCGENWDSTYNCIHKIYCEELPEILNTLENDMSDDSNSNVELRKIFILLTDSKKGLKKLKVIYKTNKCAVAHIDTILSDYVESHLTHIDKLVSIDPDSDSEGCNITDEAGLSV